MMKSNDIAIRIDRLNKSFKLPHEKQNSIKSLFVNMFHGQRTFERQQVLKDISFEIKKGDFFGVVGRNGSGKSTLLKLMAGIYAPDNGSIQINGKLTPFIELGVGFSPELTGRENVFLNGALLGFGRKEMESMYDEIVEFAELEKFMDQKLKNYSSGMQVRLAFSVAIRAQSDILVLDEVLAVGDASFQKKCYDYFMLLKKEKRTVVLVTHDMNAVRTYCNRAILLNKGKIKSEGKPEKIAQAYQKMFSSSQNNTGSKKMDLEEKNSDRWGNGKMTCIDYSIVVEEDSIYLNTKFKSLTSLDSPVYGFQIHNQAGVNLFESNTMKQNITTSPVEVGDEVEYTWRMPNIFTTGSYNVSVACCDKSTTEFYDWVNNAVVIEIIKEQVTAGVIDPKITVEEGAGHI